MTSVTLDKLVVVHPHEEFDGSFRARDQIDGALQSFEDRPEDALVLRGFKEDEWKNLTDERLPLYTDAGAYRVSDSKAGEIDDEDLKTVLHDGVTVGLFGGIIGQCHQKAFESAIEYIEKNGLSDVRVIVPFDGCYFQHGWTEWGSSDDPNRDEKRFDGVFMGGYGYEMTGANSYSLREVIAKTFGNLSGPHELHREMVRDASGEPVPATQQTLRTNVEQYFFRSYFETPREERKLTRDYEVNIEGDHLEIHIH